MTPDPLQQIRRLLAKFRPSERWRQGVPRRCWWFGHRFETYAPDGWGRPMANCERRGCPMASWKSSDDEVRTEDREADVASGAALRRCIAALGPEFGSFRAGLNLDCTPEELDKRCAEVWQQMEEEER